MFERTMQRDKPYNFRSGECSGCRFAGSEASDRHQCGPTPSPTCAAGLGPSPSLTKYMYLEVFLQLSLGLHPKVASVHICDNRHPDP